MNAPLTKEQYVCEIEADRRHGAAQLARRGLQMLADYSRHCPADSPEALSQELRDLAGRLRQARPSMAPIRNLIDRWLAEFRPGTTQSIEKARVNAATVAQALHDQSLQAVHDIAGYARRLIGRDKTIFTHSISSTLCEIFSALREDGVKVILTESRPLCEGRELAERLGRWGIPVTYITEAQIGIFIEQADLALVGADTVLADGAVVNKAGTLLLALAARRHDRPFYVGCESIKIDRERRRPEELEEMAPEELDPPQLSGVTARNVYFDVTPADLVTGWITEYGFIEEFTSLQIPQQGSTEEASCD